MTAKEMTSFKRTMRRGHQNERAAEQFVGSPGAEACHGHHGVELELRMLTITVASHRVGLSLADGIDQPRAQQIFVELPQVGLARALSPGGADRLRLATRVRSPLISPRRDGAPDPPASCALQSRRTTNRQVRYRPARG
jgi:hypothetical protein